MADSIEVRQATGPIRVRVSAHAPVAVRILTVPVAVRVTGTPGPDGGIGPQGDKGDQGAPGITLLPTETPINGGFF